MSVESARDWISKLVGNNLLAVLDVLLDIEQERQFGDEIEIRLLPSVVRFQRLMPADAINFRDGYCEARWKAANLLKKQGVIKRLNVNQAFHRWDSRLTLKIDHDEFTEVLEIARVEYKKRTSTERSKSAETEAPKEEDFIEQLRNLFLRFHSIVVQLRTRYDNRPTLDVSDEYDVQDLLGALLRVHFDDVRREEWTPSYAGKSSRVDFFLKAQGIVIETKKTRLGLAAKEIGDQLIVDIARYSKMPDCRYLVCLVYDPDNRIANPGGFQSDLTGERDGLKVEVLVVPKQY